MCCSIILNDESSHQDEISELFDTAKKFDCLVAFANYVGFKTIENHLKEKLKDEDFVVRFFVGLNFYHTEPYLLDKLFAIANRYPKRFHFYINSPNSSITFHPKVYAFYNGNRSSIIVGSANLTKGGFEDNYEVSARLDGIIPVCREKINKIVEDLLQSCEMLPATREMLDDYRTKHALYTANRNLSDKKTKRLLETFQKVSDITTEAIGTLKSILEEMKHDESPGGFYKQVEVRSQNRLKAASQLKEIRASTNIERDFISLYEPLCQNPNLWHSGGLSRGKTVISKHALTFQNALKDFEIFYNTGHKVTASSAYQFLLDRFVDIPKAGTNVITEILHTYNNSRFVVMNQNSVNGMSLAGIQNFPLKPNKRNLTHDDYALFCLKAGEILKLLKLKNFTELDAVFNYSYW